MTKAYAIIQSDSSPHASLGNDEADQAGPFVFKPRALTYPELYERLRSQGLGFGERTKDESVELLQRVGFYHLRGYWVMKESGGRFAAGTTIDSIFDIMYLDEELAEFVLGSITPIELALRSSLSQSLAEKDGAFALENPLLFKNQRIYQRTKEILSREQRRGMRSRSTFVMRNIDKYGKLPVWAAVELASLGTISKMYENLADREMSKAIAASFGMKPRYLITWLKCLTAFRNMCAHHNRLYGRMFAACPALHKEHGELDRHRLFAQLIVLFRLHDATRPQEAGSIRMRLDRIVSAHKGVDLAPVGFPDNWREVLGVPTRPATGPRARGRKGGRPPKDATAVREALFLYDAKADTVSEIRRKTGVGPTTLYKYINLRKQGKDVGLNAGEEG